jgi:DNA-binding transcriptional MerR regulator
MRMENKAGDRCVVSRTYTAGRAAEAAGISYYLLDFWAKTGVLVPKVLGVEPNTVRAYSFSDIVALRIASQLRDANAIGTDGLKALIAHLREIEFVDDSHDAHVMFTRDGMVKVCDKEEMLEMLPKLNQIYTVFPLRNTVSSIKEVAGKLKPPKRGRASLVAGK